MKKILRSILQFLLFLSIGSVILYLVYRSQNEAHLDKCCLDANPQWEQVESEAELEGLIAECRAEGLSEEQCEPLLTKLVNDFKEVRYGWIGMVLLAFVISNISRTHKWRMLLAPMGYRPRFINGLLAIFVGYFANLGLPRMGEVVRAGMLSKYERIPLEKTVGTIVVDRITDVICLGLTVLVALAFESEKILGYIAGQPEEEVASQSGWNWKWTTLIVLLVAALVLFLLRKKIAGTVVYRKVAKVLQGFWEGIQTVRKLERPWLFVLHSLNIWFLFFIMNWFGLQAFEPTAHLDLRAALTVFIFGTLGFVIPSPGGMGSFQGLVIVALTTFYGISNADAFSAANIIFLAVSIGFNSLLGIIALLLFPFVNRKKEPVADLEPSAAET